MNKKVGVLIALLLCAACLVAQVVVEKSAEKIKIDGVVYYLHTAKKGETIYSISKAYNVTQDNLQRKNPRLAEGLKLGDKLIIPLEGETVAASVSAPVTESNGVMQKHIVRKKETLYAISRQYQVDINELMRINNLPNNDIQTGMELLIPMQGSEALAKNPVAVSAENQPQTLTQTTTQTVRYHKAKDGETMADIAVMYGVPEKELTDLNRDAFRRGKLINGALLEIPAQKDLETTAQTAVTMPPLYTKEVDCANEALTARERTYKVALLLPLGATAAVIHDDLIQEDVVNSAQSNDRVRATDNFVEFYEGALLAVEDAKKSGMHLDLSVFDILNRKDDVLELIKRDALRDVDLIIGPVHAQDFAPVADYAKQHKIKIVSPIDAKTERITDTNPYVFQVNPPVSFQYGKLFSDINSDRDRNVVLVYEKHLSDTTVVEDIFNALERTGGQIRRLSHVNSGKQAVDSMRYYLNLNKDNRIVIASNDEVFVTNILAQLHQLAILRKYQITVYGTSRWRSFESIDLNYFHELNLKMEVPFYIDYKDAQTTAFIARYRASFNADPSQFAFQGYDVFSFFMQALLQYGVHFEQCIAKFTPSLLQSNYHFYRNDPQYGFWNTESVKITYTPSFTIEKE